MVVSAISTLLAEPIQWHHPQCSNLCDTSTVLILLVHNMLESDKLMSVTMLTLYI